MSCLGVRSRRPGLYQVCRNGAKRTQGCHNGSRGHLDRCQEGDQVTQRLRETNPGPPEWQSRSQDSSVTRETNEPIVRGPVATRGNSLRMRGTKPTARFRALTRFRPTRNGELPRCVFREEAHGLAPELTGLAARGKVHSHTRFTVCIHQNPQLAVGGSAGVAKERSFAKLSVLGPGLSGTRFAIQPRRS
jgi:hypothetical protein